MRIDKYLKVSRLIKRRTVANAASDAEYVSVNGKPAKAGCQVKEGDIIELSLGRRTLKVQVLNTNDNVSKADATAMYRELE